MFGFYERKKRDKREFVTKFVGIVVTVVFMYFRNISQVASKMFPTDHLNHKNINKTTSRTPSENFGQLCEH